MGIFNQAESRRRAAGGGCSGCHSGCPRRPGCVDGGGKRDELHLCQVASGIPGHEVQIVIGGGSEPAEGRSGSRIGGHGKPGAPLL